MSLPSPNADVADVESLVRTLSADPPLQRLGAIVDENFKLREENQNLLQENTITTRTIQRLQTNLDSAEGRDKAKDDKLQGYAKDRQALKSELDALGTKLKASEKAAVDLDARFKKDLEATKKALEEQGSELERLQQLSVELEPVDENEKEIAAAFNTIYSSARRLADTYFGVDLLPEVLKNGELWSKIGGHNLNVTNRVPLPSSNSVPAKQMRVALLVSVLAHELCNHIFRPTYMYLKDFPDLGEVLGTLATRDPELESHLRSVLLKASECMSSAADEAVETSCSQAIVDKVWGLVSPVIPESKQTSFKSELQNLCKTACEKWRFIQTLDERIAFDLGSSLAAKHDFQWRPLVFTVPPPPQAKATKQGANGTASSSSQGPNKNSSSAASSQSRADAPVDLTEGVAVWPAFYNLSSDNSEMVAEGFILPVSLIKAAEDEQRAAMSAATPPSPRSHRELREQDRSSNLRKRRQSLVAPVNGQAGEGKRSGSFLSNGHGGGLKGV